MDADEIRYQVIHAIDQVQSQNPSTFVSDVQIMEITRLDLQTVRDEMDLLEADGYILTANSRDGNSALLNAHGRRLLQTVATQRAQPPRARDMQQQVLAFLARWEETGSSVLAGSGIFVGDNTIADELNFDIQSVRDNLELLEQQRCVQLKRFMAGPPKLVVSLTARGRITAREPDYMPQSTSAQITNISTGGGNYVSTGGGDYAGRDIDKRQGAYFYNAGGDINFGAVQDRQGLISELEKLRNDLGQAVDDADVDADAVIDAETQIRKAIAQAKKPESDMKTILDRLNEAKALLSGIGAAAGAVDALVKAAELVQKLF